MWAIAARPDSNNEVEVARVKVPSNGRATVEIISYHFGPSDWAILGRLFTQGRTTQEALEIEKAIQSRVTR
jgi:hypothetical protein